jgi:hypothetical protein
MISPTLMRDAVPRVQSHIDFAQLIPQWDAADAIAIAQVEIDKCLEFSSRQVAGICDISVSKLHSLRSKLIKSGQLVQDKHFTETRTATNTKAYSWSRSGLWAIYDQVHGGADEQ